MMMMMMMMRINKVIITDTCSVVNWISDSSCPATSELCCDVGDYPCDGILIQNCGGVDGDGLARRHGGRVATFRDVEGRYVPVDGLLVRALSVEERRYGTEFTHTLL